MGFDIFNVRPEVHPILHLARGHISIISVTVLPPLGMVYPSVHFLSEPWDPKTYPLPTKEVPTHPDAFISTAGPEGEEKPRG